MVAELVLVSDATPMPPEMEGHLWKSSGAAKVVLSAAIFGPLGSERTLAIKFVPCCWIESIHCCIGESKGLAEAVVFATRWCSFLLQTQQGYIIVSKSFAAVLSIHNFWHV